MAFRVLIILLLTYSFSFANDNKCISCHENVCSDKPYTCTTCHRGESTTMRKDIAHYKLISGKYASFTDKSSPKTQKGIELIKDAACTRCHNIGTSGATLASDLNSAVKRLTTDELIKAIKEPVINMPNFQFSNQDIENLITGLYYYTIPQNSKSITQVVHFQGDTGGNDIFQKKCGTCHKALTSAGALGNSDDAPNLSNLTNSYPDYLNGSSWNKDLLNKWLTNPRNLKKYAVMPIIELTDEEKSAIINLLIK
ncbi:MAG TPA: c-type cytochrome [Candidatus Mucispirillum faecigallinarum]|uniref:C-type cytochrome n=1 Tax=Candidatus Mucispirillum faecigallinarum TaxID=2838699 RepID=A0A9D2GUA7_9BACT|nr:c-type cytochrome [Candidatus Mucispirillum faecigallinarum]